MKVNPNDNSIKTSFCFDANNLPALVQQLEENFQNVVNKIENIEITGDSDHKVALDEADDLDEGADYLHEKLTFHGEYVSDASSLIYAESGAVSEDLFLIWATEPGYTADGDRLWASVDGVVGWQAVDLGGALDNFTVMVTSDDNTPSYLYDAMYNHQTINDPSDLVVAFQVAGTAGTDQKLIAFVDTSAIVGYHESERRYLGVYEGISQYMTSEQVTSDVIEVIVEDGTFVAAIEKFRALRGECVGPVEGGPGEFHVDNVVVLDSGKDPRVDPLSTTETILIYNIPAESHEENDKVWADYNEESSRWEARPKRPSTTPGIGFTCQIDEAIEGGSASEPSVGEGEVFEILSGGATDSRGSATLYNPFGFAACGSCACVPAGDGYVITGVPLGAGNATIVTGVDCDEEEGFSYDTEVITFATTSCEELGE